MDEPITLAEARLHLRVDHIDEDALIAVLITAAREAAEHQIGGSLAVRWPDGDVPAGIKQWMLLTIGTLYANRESVITGISVSQFPRSLADGLLDPWRIYA